MAGNKKCNIGKGRIKCIDEAVFLQKMLSNSKYTNIILYTKQELTKLMKMMILENVDANDMLSDGIFTGNIGKDDAPEKINYLKSDEATVREKVAAISNTFWDAAKEVSIENTCKSLFMYILHNRSETRIIPLYNIICKIMNSTNVDKIKTMAIKNPQWYQLWCPLLYQYPAYIFKRTHINLHSLIGQTKPNLAKNMMVEDFSENEKKFLKQKLIDINKEFLSVETGMNLYENAICQLPDYDEDEEACRVAGVSGHAILHFTLGGIFDIDWRCILLGQLLEMVPIHHSIGEILSAANDVGYIKNVFNSHDEMMSFMIETLDNFATSTQVGGSNQIVNTIKIHGKRYKVYVKLAEEYMTVKQCEKYLDTQQKNKRK